MATRAGGPRVGIISDSSLQRHAVSKALQAFGYDVAAAWSPERIDDKAAGKADMDMWLIDLEDEDRWLDFLTALLEVSDIPVLFGAGKAPSPNSPTYPAWQRRIYAKVRDLVGTPLCAVETLAPEALKVTPKPPAAIPLPRELAKAAALASSGRGADYIWVLGASLGGPAAVKTFLDALPQGLPIAFVIAQHIDAGFQKVLGQVLGRHNHFHYVETVEGYVLMPGDVYVVPVEQVVSIDTDSRICFHGGEWDGPYAPSIDQVMDSTSRALGARCGAILFSGMGNDGSIAGPRMKALGLPVWAQTADTCASASQPDSARAAGCVTFSGSPRDLALHLTHYAKKHYASGAASSEAHDAPESPAGSSKDNDDTSRN